MIKIQSYLSVNYIQVKKLKNHVISILFCVHLCNLNVFSRRQVYQQCSTRSIRQLLLQRFDLHSVRQIFLLITVFLFVWVQVLRLFSFNYRFLIPGTTQFETWHIMTNGCRSNSNIMSDSSEKAVILNTSDPT